MCNDELNVKCAVEKFKKYFTCFTLIKIDKIQYGGRKKNRNFIMKIRPNRLILGKNVITYLKNNEKQKP